MMIRPEDIDVADGTGGSRSALARALTLVEDARDGAAQLLEALGPRRGRAHVVGVTGAPGAGKSTLINALLGEWLRRGRRIAVVAIDPSSPVTGGALLGDRLRMGEHGGDERVFIRSLSSRGHLGGLSRTTGEVVDVFDAAGFDVVVVETVGVGQSEVDVRALADTNLVVCAPGLGDDVQAVKAGILETADIFVVNKGDSPLASRAVLDLQQGAFLRHDERGPVPVLLTVATSGRGIVELADQIDAHARSGGVGRRLGAARKGAETAASGGSREIANGRADGAAVDSTSAMTPGTATGRPAAAVATDGELFQQVQRWRAEGKGVALATVVRTWGSSPRPEGSHLAIDEHGAFVGSVSGGCIEGAVIGEAQSVIADGQPRVLEFGVSDEQAWEVGLACGGRVQVFVERIG
ncbi:MAG: methylmalonyl Co-A mutase-associated GTPase MeaB [Aromatoleum sp.]|jgi:LAO/AO transport system ATPase|uniref:methylmalonyl Co-A mutase-associated GTPase MeaB n=1 Tax=Aromatoleum sp. TaxID=2307007 RepID=UPI0028950E4E|nr:methylmalonyl Co-A mutase-associated GTPase MeaB [Aromatoleum sp.]MDT3669416.1 methylmalonyl Co-A mutase-associated GTPase MeaB [Aromatoleum sp.]